MNSRGDDFGHENSAPRLQNFAVQSQMSDLDAAETYSHRSYSIADSQAGAGQMDGKLLVQNFMKMVETNPELQELMANQFQGLMTQQQPSTQNLNFAKQPASKQDYTSNQQPTGSESAANLGIQPTITAEPWRDGSEDSNYASGMRDKQLRGTQSGSVGGGSSIPVTNQSSAAKKPANTALVSKIDELIMKESEDLDEFYHRFSRNPKKMDLGPTYPQYRDSSLGEARPQSYKSTQNYDPPAFKDSFKETYGDRDRQMKSTPPRPSQVERGSAGYHSGAKESRRWDLDETEHNDLLDTGKASLLLPGMSEMVPFRHSYDSSGGDRRTESPNYGDGPILGGGGGRYHSKNDRDDYRANEASANQFQLEGPVGGRGNRRHPVALAPNADDREDPSAYSRGSKGSHENDYYNQRGFSGHEDHPSDGQRGAYKNPYDDIPVGGSRKQGKVPQDSSFGDTGSMGAAGSKRTPEQPADRRIRAKANQHEDNQQNRKDSFDQSRHSPENDHQESRYEEDRPLPVLSKYEQQQVKNSGKTFEQLLEEQIAAEGGQSTTAVSGPTDNEVHERSGASQPRKHNFLKKGSRSITPKAPPAKKAGKTGSAGDPGSHKGQGDRSADRPSDQGSGNEVATKEYDPSEYMQEDKTHPGEGREGSATVPVYDDQEPWEAAQASGVQPKKQPDGKKSKVVESYFNHNKKDKKKEEVLHKQAQLDEEAIVKKYVSSKIEELEAEARKLKIERDTLKAKERKVEEQGRALAKERLEFEKYMSKERDKLEEAKEEELKKIRKQQKVSERNMKATANIPSRKEREEIEALKDRLNKQADEFVQKEKKLKMTNERYKKQIDDILKQNGELHEQIQVLERERTRPGQGPSKPAAGNDKKGAAGGTNRIVVEHSRPAETKKKYLEDEDLEEFEKHENAAEFEDYPEDSNNGAKADKRQKSRSRAMSGIGSEAKRSRTQSDALEEGGAEPKFRLEIVPEEYAYNANQYYKDYMTNKKKRRISLNRQPTKDCGRNQPRWQERGLVC